VEDRDVVTSEEAHAAVVEGFVLRARRILEHSLMRHHRALMYSLNLSRPLSADQPPSRSVNDSVSRSGCSSAAS
jgi:hypothetical protein